MKDDLEIGKLYRITRSCELYYTEDNLLDYMVLHGMKSGYYGYGFTPKNIKLLPNCEEGDFCMALDTFDPYDHTFIYVKILIKENVGWIFDTVPQRVILQRVL